MRKLFAFGLVVFMAYSAQAQEAAFDTPLVRSSEAKMTVVTFLINTTPASGIVEVAVKDSANVEIRRETHVVPDDAHPGATVSGLVTALLTVRANETGTNPRKASFRVLGYLSDQGYLPGTTLVP